MNCDDVRPLLDASMDRELSAADDWRLRQHLSTCTDCQRESAALRTVSGAVRKATYHRAPEGLHTAILAGLPAVTVSGASGASGMRGAAAGTAADATVGTAAEAAAGGAWPADGRGAGAKSPESGRSEQPPASAGSPAGGRRSREGRRFPLLGLLFPGATGPARGEGATTSGGTGAPTLNPGWIAAFVFGLCTAALAGSLFLHRAATSDDGGPFVDELVASHVRAELSGRDIDVISTDRHTVKPWFNGRIDYAPPVVDLAAQGFALVGGRLDYVGHERVAVLVYRYRKHVIDVYVFPPGARAAEGPAPGVPHDGYSVVRWQADGMAWWAVSDAEPDALAALHKALDTNLQGAGTETGEAGG